MTVGCLDHASCYNNQCSHHNVGCWNICSLVEAEGSVNTPSIKRGVSIDRKITLILVEELRWFEMSITDVIDTKRFGQRVYEVTWFTYIHPVYM